PGARFVSATTGEGIADLVETIEEKLPSPNIEVSVLIPYERGDLVSKIYALGTVDHEEHGEGGTGMHAKVPAELAAELEEFRRPDMVIGE
ncbi:GTPase HflX, partial [Burkholderia multivorans]